MVTIDAISNRIVKDALAIRGTFQQRPEGEGEASLLRPWRVYGMALS